MTEIAVLGVDLGKNTCSVVALDATGRVVLRRRLHRDGVVRLAAGSPGCVVAVEAWLAGRTTSAGGCARPGTRCG